MPSQDYALPDPDCIPMGSEHTGPWRGHAIVIPPMMRRCLDDDDQLERRRTAYPWRYSVESHRVESAVSSLEAHVRQRMGARDRLPRWYARLMKAADEHHDWDQHTRCSRLDCMAREI